MRYFLPLIALALLALSASSAMAAERTHTIVPEDYFQLEYTADPTYSPSGRLVAYRQTGWAGPGEKRKGDLWVMDATGDAPLRLTFDLAGIRGVAWGGNDDWVYFGASYDRGEEKPPYDGSAQLWRVRPDGTDLQALTRVKDGIGQFQLARDGSALYYTVDEEKFDEEWKDLRKKWKDMEYGHGVGDRSALRRLDLRSWRDDEILPAENVIHLLALAPRGDRLALQVTPDEELIFAEGWSRIDVLDLNTGAIESIADEAWRKDHPSPYGWLTEMAWSEDGRCLAFDVGYDGYPTEIWVAEWSPGVHLWKLDRPGEIHHAGHLAWRGKGRSLTFLGEQRGRVGICEIRDVRGGTQGSGGVMHGVDVVVTSFGFDREGRSAMAAGDFLDRVGELHRVEKGSFTRLTDVNALMEEWILPQIQDFTWTGADGDEVHGIVELPADYDPATDGPIPTIIELHGGPTSSTKYRFRLWTYGRALYAANGYAMMSPNYHGSTGFGDEFLRKLIGRENEVEVTDIALGTEAMIAAGIADPAHIGVSGWSNGGYLTNCMIVARPDLYAAASSGAGVLDMVIQWGIEDTPGHVINFVEGLPWEKPHEYQKASPLYGLDRVKTPTLIHVGENDPRVPAAHAKTLYRALRHYLDVPTELVIYPGQPHGLGTYETRLAKVEWDLAWFEKYLKGDPTEDKSTPQR